MALGCACISPVRLTHLPLPALFSKRVLVIHLHVLRDRRWTVVTRGGVQVRSNQPFSSCSPTRHFFPAVSRERDLWILSFFFFPSSLSLSLPSSPSSSILFPQHSYLRMDLQKNNRNHSFTRWHSTDHSGMDSLQPAGVIWSTRPGPLCSQPHDGHSQCHVCVSLSFTHRPFCRYV